MTAGTKNDFKIYDEQFYAGVWEGITQFTNAFNAASGNAIRLVAQDLKGDYAKQAFFKRITSAIARRDITSTSTVNSLPLVQGELISVKINRRFGPVEDTKDAFRKIATDPQEFSLILGQMFGAEKAQDMLNTGLLAAAAAIEGQAALNYDVTGLTDKTLSTLYLVKALAKMGDAAERVKAWGMHSKPYFDLVGEQIGAKIVNVADRVVYGGTPATLNRPVVITDSPALTDANGSATDTYNVLGLVEDGIVVTESEQQEISAQEKLGGENITIIVQGEYAYNVGVKGFAWNTNSGVNPTDAALATTSNWIKAVTDNKDLAGVRLLCQ